MKPLILILLLMMVGCKEKESEIRDKLNDCRVLIMHQRDSIRTLQDSIATLNASKKSYHLGGTDTFTTPIER